MIFVYPDIDCVFDTDLDKVNTIIIENQSLFCSLINDLESQLSLSEGRSVLSQENKLLPIDKNLELLDRFIPFEINKKALISRITTDLENKAVSEDYYLRVNELLGSTESLLMDLSLDYPCSIAFSKLNIGSIIKSTGVEICDDYDSLGEKIIDYCQLVNELLGRKLFVTVNLRSFLSDSETKFFMQTVISHRLDVIMIEGYEHTKLDEEKRLIIDADFCLIV